MVRRSKMKEITLKIKDIHRMIRELDTYSRLYMGQYEEIFRVREYSFMFQSGTELRDICYKLRTVVIPKLFGVSFNGSLGIWGPDTPMNAQRAYDIQQILRYQLAYHEKPGGGNTVNFNNPFIHGKWKISDEDMKILDEIIQKYYYPDYGPRGFYRHAWQCPLIISEFKEDEAVVLRDAKKIDRFIEDAHQFNVYLDNNQIYKAFLLLYPHMKENHLMKELCIAIEKENRRII